MIGYRRDLVDDPCHFWLQKDNFLGLFYVLSMFWPFSNKVYQTTGYQTCKGTSFIQGFVDNNFDLIGLRYPYPQTVVKVGYLLRSGGVDDGNLSRRGRLRPSRRTVEGSH